VPVHPPGFKRNPSYHQEPRPTATGPGRRRPTTAETRAKRKVAKKAPGAQQHRGSRQGHQRADKPYRYGQPDRFPDLAEPPELRYVALLANGKRVALTHVADCAWDDATAILKGTLTTGIPTFREYDPELRLDQGDRVACFASEHGGGFREVWTMRVSSPGLSLSDRQRQYQLVSDLDLLRQSEDNFLFRSDKAHPHGWTGPQIIRAVCKAYNVRIGGLYTAKYPLATGGFMNKTRRLKVVRGSPLEVIRHVLLREKRRHGRRLVIRWHRGKLYVVPMRRSPHLLALGPTLIDARFQSALREQFASAITIHALQEFKLGQDALGRGKSKLSKLHVYLESDVSRRLFGYVHKIVWSPDATSDALLRKEGLAYLAAAAKPYRTLTLTHQGMPFLRRGDAIRVQLGDAALKRQVVWVSEVSHQHSAQGYTMDVSVVFDDPYVIRPRNVLFKLKASHADAVGNRARLDPLWYLPKNNKGDQPYTSATPVFSDQAATYQRRRLRASGGGGVGTPGAVYNDSTGEASGGPFG
jgi:hypothetical protein